MKFLSKVVKGAWSVSPWRNSLIITAILVAAASTVLAPYALGQGIARLVPATSREEFVTTAGAVAVIYSLLWLLGSAATYLVYPLYGLVEQKLQSDVMARSLKDSICAEPSVRYRLDNGEISFAIDTEAGAYRDSLSSLYLSIFPAFLSLVAGLFGVVSASSWIEGLILLVAVVAYLLISKPLIATHQEAQAAFFKENMRSFGVLGNSLTLWKEATIFRVPEFLFSRYRSDRSSVEDAARTSYAATRRLYLAQTFILACTIFGLVFSISNRAPVGGASVIGAIVSTVGIAVAAIGPLQSVGFGVSALAVAIAQECEAGEKIRPSIKEADNDAAAWQPQVDELRELISRGSGRPIWVLGPSGVGKTTVLEGLLGLNVNDRKLPLKSSYVQQSPGLLNATAVENVAFGRDDAVANADSLLVALGLDNFVSDGADGSRDVAGEEGGVSGGERQRIAIARAFASEDTFVVLDEPTSGLDSATRAKVWKLIESYALHNAVVVATHDESAPIREDDAIFRPNFNGGERESFS